MIIIYYFLAYLLLITRNYSARKLTDLPFRECLFLEKDTSTHRFCYNFGQNVLDFFLLYKNKTYLQDNGFQMYWMPCLKCPTCYQRDFKIDSTCSGISSKILRVVV